MAERKKAVQVERAYLAHVRHPIKAARLLYSAPSWVLRGPVYLIAIISVAAVCYSFVAKKDELVVVPLVLERASGTIEAVVGGMISRVAVQEGERVSPQTTLVEVQKTRVGEKSDAETLRSKRDEVQKDIETEDREYENKKEQLQISLDRTTLSVKNVKKDREILQQQLSAAERDVGFRESKLGEAKKTLAEEAALYKARDITKVEYQAAQAKVDDWEKGVLDARSELGKIRVSLGALSEDKIGKDIKQAENELRQAKERHAVNRKRLEERAAGIDKQIKDEETLLLGVTSEGHLSTYKSSYEGLVTRVHVKAGQIISPGTPLVTIVKESSALEGRVAVQNKDIGRMKRGQTVQIKYFAYPYQEFGIPTGVISDIASRPGGTGGGGGGAAAAGQDSLYAVRVALHAETIKKREGPVQQLAIGLEGVAEIKTGEKRFIELVFSPISRFFTQTEE